MFESMRKVFGPVAVSIIIGAIALVFVFYGVFNPRSTSGVGGGALAATVNGDGITMQDYGRQYQQRVDYYQSMMKGKADPALLKQLGIGKQIIEEMIRNNTRDNGEFQMTRAQEIQRQREGYLALEMIGAQRFDFGVPDDFVSSVAGFRKA